VNRAFRLGVVLILIFLAGSLLAGVAYRAGRIASRDCAIEVTRD
jgi:hypothetical protein